MDCLHRLGSEEQADEKRMEFAFASPERNVRDRKCGSVGYQLYARIRGRHQRIGIGQHLPFPGDGGGGDGCACRRRDRDSRNRMENLCDSPGKSHGDRARLRPGIRHGHRQGAGGRAVCGDRLEGYVRQLCAAADTGGRTDKGLFRLCPERVSAYVGLCGSKGRHKRPNQSVGRCCERGGRTGMECGRLCSEERLERAVSAPGGGNQKARYQGRFFQALLPAYLRERSDKPRAGRCIFLPARQSGLRGGKATGQNRS